MAARMLLILLALTQKHSELSQISYWKCSFICALLLCGDSIVCFLQYLITKKYHFTVCSFGKKAQGWLYIQQLRASQKHTSPGLSVVVFGGEERTQVSVRILHDNAKNPKIHVCAQIHVFQS